MEFKVDILIFSNTCLVFPLMHYFGALYTLGANIPFFLVIIDESLTQNIFEK